MPNFVKQIMEGTHILFGDSKKHKLKRNKQINTSKELRIAKARMRQGSMNRSISRIKDIKEAALN